MYPYNHSNASPEQNRPLRGNPNCVTSRDIRGTSVSPEIPRKVFETGSLCLTSRTWGSSLPSTCRACSARAPRDCQRVNKACMDMAYQRNSRRSTGRQQLKTEVRVQVPLQCERNHLRKPGGRSGKLCSSLLGSSCSGSWPHLRLCRRCVPASELP